MFVILHFESLSGGIPCLDNTPFQVAALKMHIADHPFVANSLYAISKIGYINLFRQRT